MQYNSQARSRIIERLRPCNNHEMKYFPGN